MAVAATVVPSFTLITSRPLNCVQGHCSTCNLQKPDGTRLSACVARPTSTARRELGNELRRLRGDRRAAVVATSLGWSESKLSRIETAHTGISEGDLDRLLTVYGIRVEDRDRLFELARRGRMRAW